MHRRLSLISLAVAASLAGSTALAQPAAPAPRPLYGPDITSDQAQAAMTAAEAEARRLGINVSIAILEPSADLVMFKKLPNASYGTVEMAMGKARTAALNRRPSSEIQASLMGGDMRMLAMPKALPFMGGIPVIVGGKVIGAIGVSGGTGEQDVQVGSAGAAAVR